MTDSIPVWPPQAGFYTMRLTRGGVRVPVRIWFGPPVIDGEELDRSPDWRCEIDGRADTWERDDATGYRCRVAIHIDRAWPYAAREPISESEYRFLVAHSFWAREHAPDHPKAQPRKSIDFNTIPLQF